MALAPGWEGLYANESSRPRLTPLQELMQFAEAQFGERFDERGQQIWLTVVDENSDNGLAVTDGTDYFILNRENGWFCKVTEGGDGTRALEQVSPSHNAPNRLSPDILDGLAI